MSDFFSITVPRSDFMWSLFLRGFGPDGETMERLLHDLAIMDHSGWPASPASTLTRTGAPAQITFQTDTDRLCVTADLPGTGIAVADRVNQACKDITRFCGQFPDPVLRQMLAAAQADSALDFGARLELSVAARQLDMQVLAELPARSIDIAQHVMPAASAAFHDIGDKLSLKTLGFGSKTGCVSLYGSISGAAYHHLLSLAQIVGVAPDPLAAAIEGLARFAHVGVFPVPTLDWRLTTGPLDQPPELTVFLDAADLLGDHETAFRRIMACGGDRMPGYAAFMDDWRIHRPGQAPHNQIGLIAQKRTMPKLLVTVAAPWSPTICHDAPLAQGNRCS